eukprot:g63529.t1
MFVMPLCMPPPPFCVDKAWFPAGARLTDSLLYLAETRYNQQLGASTGTDLSQGAKSMPVSSPAGFSDAHAARRAPTAVHQRRTASRRGDEASEAVGEEDGEEGYEDSLDLMDAGMDDLEDEDGALDGSRGQEAARASEDDDNPDDLNLSEDW